MNTPRTLAAACALLALPLAACSDDDDVDDVDDLDDIEVTIDDGVATTISPGDPVVTTAPTGATSPAGTSGPAGTSAP